MKVLIGCEESQAVCIEFRKLGHEAYSCDLQECSGGHPEWHLQMDVFEAVKLIKPELGIFHPPCTYLSNAGAIHLFPKGILNQDRYLKGLQARDFFMRILELPIKKICIENPTPSKIYQLPIAMQTIQPFHFGDAFQKRTLLWLRGIPLLKSTNIVLPKAKWISSRRGDSIKNGCQTNKKMRSKTFPGIAKAMAEQWGNVDYKQSPEIKQLELFA